MARRQRLLAVLFTKHPQPTLDAIKIQILKGIAQEGGSHCELDMLAEWFELQGNPLNPFKLELELNELQEQHYIKLHDTRIDFFPWCELTQEGRRFLNDHGLLDEQESSM